VGCFWTTNPAEPTLPVPGIDPRYSFHCADCNSVACAELGGTWLPFSCDWFMGIPGWRRGLDIFDCPIDGSGDESEVGYCCLPSNDGKSCIVTGPEDDFMECMTSGGQWIPQSYGTLNEIQARCDQICQAGNKTPSGPVEEEKSHYGNLITLEALIQSLKELAPAGERAMGGDPPTTPNSMENNHNRPLNRPLKKSNIERQKFWEGYSNDT